MKLLNLMMRNVHSKVFKIFYRQKTSHSAHDFVKTALDHTDINSKKIKICPPEVLKGISTIKEYSFPIPWDKVTDILADGKGDVHKVILKSCLELRNTDIIISYYKYFTEKGKTFSELHFYMIVQALSQCPVTEVLKYEDTIINLYKKCKEYLLSSELFQTNGLELFSYFPYCYRDILQPREDFSLFKKDVFISRAFDFDDVDLAWTLLGEIYSMNEKVLNSYINSCIRRVICGKFSFDDIQKICDMCQKKGLIFNSADVLCTLQPLIHVLTYCQDNYTWSVKKSIVNSQGECLNCDTFLRKIVISDDEFKSLKNAVYKFIISDKDVFLKTSETELNHFKHFIRQCKPYDLVVDGLNFIYRGINSNKKYGIYYLFRKFVIENKKRVLIVARKHLNIKNLLSLPNVQFFFTENSSEDDVFILYAAMQGGLGTGVLTSDFFGTHAAKLDPEMRLLFIKWQFYHQHMFDTKFGIVMPNQHIGLPQCTESPEMGGKTYKWHIPYQENYNAPYGFRPSFDWLCLQATPRKNIKKSLLTSSLLRNIKIES